MKKLFFILSMAMALCLGGQSIEAQTTSQSLPKATQQFTNNPQNGNKSQGFGPAVFFEKEGCYKRNVPQTLSSLGFKKQSKSKWAKDGFIVEQDPFGDFTIIFPSQADLNKFINEMKAYNGTTPKDFNTLCGIMCYIDGL